MPWYSGTPGQAELEDGYTIDEFETIWREINGWWDAADPITVIEFEYVGRFHSGKDESEQAELTNGGSRIN